MSHKTMALMVLLFSSLSQASTIENDELLLKSLIERGVICPGLTYEDNREALRIYLNAKHVKGSQFDLKNKQEIESTNELGNTNEIESKNKLTNKRQIPKTPKECIRPNSDNRSE
ncbi:hypothetical protein [Vibrio crassostreae]|uniref:hypothetical protein n=1 Tax=Vibrio crassostreae TaxID=246167 RepID=UPI001043F174|nr:hypothetical protein [Vibrio crassostreae]TCO01855.1 hypothetical protein EDB51_106136 [Vibrio crassostreae]CAK2042591.1 conserved exported hypothetical protein [Vibrio crassostreae]CAK2079265.1 conserved exported hypothetical protein [Vibrio crassostreae]CAK2084719.1 conserved exported hypothetical protein [Vibrio crassostreae]CAK2863583.1 conserved exported hypothetical protein [Vibrio crassostreae]